MERSGVEVITAPFFLSVPEFLERRAAEFDAVYIIVIRSRQRAIPTSGGMRLRADPAQQTTDLHFLRELRAALSAGDPSRMAAVRAVL